MAELSCVGQSQKKLLKFVLTWLKVLSAHTKENKQRPYTG